MYGIFRVDVVTCIREGENVVFGRDDGVLLIPEPAFSHDSYATGQRVLLQYTPLQEDGPDRGKEKIGIKAFSPVTTQPVLFYSADQLLSTPDDGIYLQSIWLGGGFINVRFQIEVNRSDVRHRLSLICNKDRMGEDRTVWLELRHDRQGDTAGYLAPGYASFSLDTFNLAETDAFRVKINALNYKNTPDFTLQVAGY